MEIKRDRYLNLLISKKHNGLIKVITGMRRCGKSYLLFTLFKDYLLSEGIEGSHIMENIIFNELKSRGFNVNVGIVEVRERQGDSLLKKQFEVDFVANKDSRRFYIQSALEIPDQRKMQQESASLRNIQDAFKKIIIVRNDFRPWYNEDGILILSLYDFLLNPASLDL